MSNTQRSRQGDSRQRADHHPAVGTRTGVPAVTATVQPRPQPSATLSEAVARQSGSVVLVCAPAGTGKTVLLCDWINRHAEGPARVEALWVTLTDRDNTPSVLWADIGGALSTPADKAAYSTCAETDELWTETPLVFAAKLGSRNSNVVVVLDDAHLLRDPLALRGVTAFLDVIPANVTVMIAGRYEPTLPWHSYAAQGKLVRLDWQDLALDHHQVGALLADRQCALSPSDVRRLTELTHGWPALVQIAGISLHGRRDSHDAIEEFARSPHPVSDYLAGELFSVLPDDIYRFLLATSLVDDFTVDLAEYLTRADAAESVWFLETRGFPLLKLPVEDGHPRYRYHPLLLAHLRADLHRREPDREADLHSVAARWYLAHHLPIDALSHLLAVGTPGPVDEFAHHHGLSTVLFGRSEEMFALLDRSEASDSTMVRLLHALAAIARQAPEAAQAYLDTLPVSTSRGADALVEASLAAALSIDAAIETGRPPPADDVAALETLAATGRSDIDCYVLTQRAAAAIFAGHLAAGDALLRKALALADLSHHAQLRVRCITRLATCAGLDGDIVTMGAAADQALVVATEHRLNQSIDLHQSVAMSAMASYLRKVDPGRIVAESVLQHRSDGTTVPLAGRHSQVVTDLLLTESTSDPRAVLESLRSDLFALFAESPHPLASSGLVPHVIAILLRAGRTLDATHTLAQARRVLDESPNIAVADAMIQTARCRHHKARDILTPVLESPDLHLVTAIRAWFVDAIAAYRLDHANGTWRSMERAVELATPQHIIRPFLDSGADAVTLLTRLSQRTGRGDVFLDDVRRTIAGYGNPRASLTRTELAVLQQLPSGRTASEISAELHVSVNTVKTHFRNLYRKLDAGSRAEAIAAALRQGIL